MVNEIEIGLNFVNGRCNTSYTDPEDVLVDCENYAARLVSGDDVFFEYDAFRMAISLFASSHEVMRPLESATARKASELWIKRCQGR